MKDPDKIIIGFLLFLLTFVGGWEASNRMAQAQIRQITDYEIQRMVGPQLAAITQKLADISDTVKQIAQSDNKR